MFYYVVVVHPDPVQPDPENGVAGTIEQVFRTKTGDETRDIAESMAADVSRVTDPRHIIAIFDETDVPDNVKELAHGPNPREAQEYFERPMRPQNNPSLLN